MPYMGNIQMEVFPVNLNSLRRKESSAVNVISRHQPRMPQWIKLWIIFFMFSVLPVWDGIIPWWGDTFSFFLTGVYSILYG